MLSRSGLYATIELTRDELFKISELMIRMRNSQFVQDCDTLGANLDNAYTNLQQAIQRLSALSQIVEPDEEGGYMPEGEEEEDELGKTDVRDFSHLRRFRKAARGE